MSDSGEIDNAIIAKLTGDATLTGLMPDGVYYSQAPVGKKKFVIVSLILADDEPMFNARAFEDSHYLVKAVELSSSGTNTRLAAARIDALLDGQPLTIPGYSHMVTQREERFREVEVDDADPTIIWQHRGGQYQVMVSG